MCLAATVSGLVWLAGSSLLVRSLSFAGEWPGGCSSVVAFSWSFAGPFAGGGLPMACRDWVFRPRMLNPSGNPCLTLIGPELN
jgi:hypothetical protein|uniref:Secreted protein n=1 Tax=Picea glauca TaxID=3330 RepID=A0A101M0G7_PICGL|nr:hypothetical protein ABT39_MTgene4702 [Picea glauca]QHR90951.1 hypothetical protein Q903MT_gene4980 [Picea sitchensis]